MSAQDNLGPQWFHGTRAELEPGALIVPGHTVTSAHPALENVGPGRTAKYVHATPDPEVASNYADRAALPAVGRYKRPRGTPHVYEVSFTGEHEPDPDGRSFDRRSSQPLRVTRVIR